ncbi:DUF2235 domain-containing protein [Rhizobium sp. CAU 1783]
MNLVVCCDGTWNTPDMVDQGVPTPTNVWKFHNAVAPEEANGTRQERYYHPGVGTDGTWWDKLVGGGTGRGLDRNIMSAYRWLAGLYKPGDRIFLIGFSRGAYTVRSLGGMISKCGLLDLSSAVDDDKLWKSIEEVFAAYRAEGASPIKASKARPFHNTAAGELPTKKTPIHFIGVWDTVGSLGIPDDMAFLNLIDDPDGHRFHNTALSDIVAHARHAVAIDEQRQNFLPTLWDPKPGADLKQLWFPGVHGDVGGGYAQTGLSDGALTWMIEEAQAAGLAIRGKALSQLAPDPNDVLHDSVTGLFKALKTRPRAVPLITTRPRSADIHASALDRHQDPPLDAGDYWTLKPLPATVDIFARQHWNATGIFLEKGKTYKLSAGGQWMDASIKCGPGGTADGKFEPAEIAQVASSLFGKLENLTKTILKNEQVDFWWTKREEDEDWFCLIGLIANNEPPPKKSSRSRAVERLPHEVFRIGEKVTIKPKASGYLYCFANDAWHAYENNRGSVRLTIDPT